jgi:UDP-glucose 4-epimerase
MSELYLVTGGCGFIGSHIVSELRRQGKRVRVLDISNGDDILDSDYLDICMDGVDYVLHQAAIPSIQRSIELPLHTNRVNVEGTLNVLAKAQQFGVKRFVFASSSSVYGKNPQCPKVETMTPEPISPYAVSKYAGELYCQCYYEIYNLPVVILRYFNVFGPGQEAQGDYAAIIPKLLEAAQTGEIISIYGDGEQSRDFTYIGNVVQANLLACEADGVEGETFNVATGTEMTLNVLIDAIEDVTGKQIGVTRKEKRKGDVRRSVASIRKAQDLLGYSPNTDIKTALQQTWQVNNDA